MTKESRKIDEAVEAWIAVLGEEHVWVDAQRRQAWAEATFATEQSVLGVICPEDRGQVQECLRVANTHKVPVYPVSCGKNWGLGSRVPVRDGCVVMSLARMTRIVDFDDELGTLTVEPGVTFQQAYEFLVEQESSFLVSVLGGSPDASLIGNILERGDGIGPYGERLAHSCGMEVVLATGECLRTGFGRFAEARTAQLDRWGLGPHLDGLFTQSSLGVVTEMTVWLMPRPAHLEVFFCAFGDDKGFMGGLDACRALVLRQILPPNSLSFWNAYKLLAREQSYPWESMQGEVPLELAGLSGLAPWYGCGALYAGSAAHGQAMREIVREALLPHASALDFFDTRQHAEMLHASPFFGVPSDQNLRSMYWRKKGELSSIDMPERDRCGVLWLCPSLPFDGEEILEALELCEKVALAHKLEPNLGLGCGNPRSVRLYVALMYDRDVPGEDERAMTCHDAMLQQLHEAGFPPYRLGIQAMDKVPPSTSPYEATLQRIKAALDPNHILSPGRYTFDHS